MRLNKSEVLKIKYNETGASSFCVCMNCFLSGRPDIYDFYKFREWEVCGVCLDEIKRIEELKDKRKLSDYENDFEGEYVCDIR